MFSTKSRTLRAEDFLVKKELVRPVVSEI